VKKLDLFQCARVDKKTPIETTIKVLAQLIKEGKISHIGLSECSAATIRKAHAVHPITAVEIGEYHIPIFSFYLLQYSFRILTLEYGSRNEWSTRDVQRTWHFCYRLFTFGPRLLNWRIQKGIYHVSFGTNVFR
jgi:hypothetical protein